MPHPSLVEEFKERILSFLRQQPFEPFRIVMDSGDVPNVEHPENFSMWPSPETNTFNLYSHGGQTVYGHFEKLTAVEVLEGSAD